jgi:hypothetical protein
MAKLSKLWSAIDSILNNFSTTNTSGVDFVESSDGDIYLTIKKNVVGIAEITNETQINLNTPSVSVQTFSGNVGDLVAIGIDGALVPLQLATPPETITDVNAGPVVIPENVLTDLGVSLVLTENFLHPTFEYKVTFDNTTNQNADISLEVFANGSPTGNIKAFTVGRNDIDTLVGFIPVAGNVTSGTDITLGLSSNKNGTATNITEILRTTETN